MSLRPGRHVAETYVIGKQSLWLPKGLWTPAITSGPAAGILETATNKINLETFDFDGAADEFLHYQHAFPKSWNKGTVSFNVHWTTSATDTDGVAWGLQAVAIADDGTLDVAYGTAIVVTDDNGGAANDLMITAESAAVTIAGSLADNRGVAFRLLRDVSDANDDMAEDARFIGATIFWSTEAANDS